VSQVYTCCEQVEDAQVANPAPKRELPLPLDVWDWNAGMDSSVNNDSFPQQQHDAWLGDSDCAADAFVPNDAALLLMQMGAHPLTPTNTGTLDKAVVSEPGSTSMGRMNSAVMMDNAATSAFSDTATSAFSDTGSGAFFSAATGATGAFNDTAAGAFSDTGSGAFFSAATGAFNDTATGAFYNKPWSMLDSPAADSLNSSPVTATYGTGMDSFSYGTADGSIGSEPLDAWNMSSKRSVKRGRGKLTDTSRHKHRLDGFYKHCCLEWRACMGICGGVLFAL
jgi:hypothetical protein